MVDSVTLECVIQGCVMLEFSILQYVTLECVMSDFVILEYVTLECVMLYSWSV